MTAEQDGDSDADSAGDRVQEWPDGYETVRYRGPQPWPVPGGWVLSIVEADGTIWYRFPGIGEGMQHDNDVADIYGADVEDYEAAREEMAVLGHDTVEFDARGGTETVKHTLEVGSEVVFERVDPERDDLLATTAEALARYANGQDLDDLAPETGRAPAAEADTDDGQARGEDSASLGDFA